MDSKTSLTVFLLCACSAGIRSIWSRKKMNIKVDRKIKSYPNEVLQGKLYLGDQFDANDLVVMKNLKITHVVNVTSEIPNHFEKQGTIGQLM